MDRRLRRRRRDRRGADVRPRGRERPLVRGPCLQHRARALRGVVHRHHRAPRRRGRAEGRDGQPGAARRGAHPRAQPGLGAFARPDRRRRRRRHRARREPFADGDPRLRAGGGDRPAGVRLRACRRPPGHLRRPRRGQPSIASTASRTATSTGTARCARSPGIPRSKATPSMPTAATSRCATSRPRCCARPRRSCASRRRWRRSASSPAASRTTSTTSCRWCRATCSSSPGRLRTTRRSSAASPMRRAR